MKRIFFNKKTYFIIVLAALTLVFGHIASVTDFSQISFSRPLAKANQIVKTHSAEPHYAEADYNVQQQMIFEKKIAFKNYDRSVKPTKSAKQTKDVSKPQSKLVVGSTPRKTASVHHYAVTDTVKKAEQITKSQKNHYVKPVASHTESTKKASYVAQPARPAYTLSYMGRTLHYANGGRGSGQAIIDGNHMAVSTWGGAAVFSGTDGMNTHFIGHNDGAFSNLNGVGIGSQITVTDGTGHAFTYHVTQKVTVSNSTGQQLGTGVPYFDKITGTGGGERITLQTCVNYSSSSPDLIVFASK